MLLVVLTGAVGGGKTTTLRQVAERLLARGRRVVGFLQPAGTRLRGNGGAEYYDLVLIPSGTRLPFATRDEDRRPRYQFSEPDIEMDLGNAEVVVLDEFGPLEATGAGHLRFWPGVLEANPDIVLLSIRDDQISDVSKRLGHPIDLTLDVREPQVAQRLEALCVDARDWESVGVYGAGAGALEATIGSALHGAKIPLRGQFLSTLQAVVLTSAAEGLARPERVGWVALIAAGLKALSPAGSRLRPMLAISVQGTLYSCAVRVFGFNRLSAFLGGCMVGAWAASQGVLLQWLLVGGDLFKAYDTVVHWIANQLGVSTPALPIVLGFLIAASSLMTGGITLAFWNRRHKGLERLRTMKQRVAKPQRHPYHPIWSTVREIAHPAFWLPIAFIIGVLLATGSPMESALMIGLRAMAVGLVLFGALRMIRVEAIANSLQKRGLLGPAIAMNRVFKRGP